MDHEIDAVILWVNGDDPEWQKVKSKYSPQKDSDDRVNRYRDWGLLPYWFRGIEKFAPFIRKVHFVTFGHLPDFLNTDCEKLNIVKHDDYMPNEYLPTFSSHPIELNLHRIDDLAEHFVYFNDDMYLIRPAKREDFFKNGLPKDQLCEVPFRFFPGGIDHIIGNDMALINKNFDKKKVIEENFGKYFPLNSPKTLLSNLYMSPSKGFSEFQNPHQPYNLLKSVFNDVWNAEGDFLNETSLHKFRSDADCNIWLMRYWQFCTGKFTPAAKISGQFFSIDRDDDEIIDAIVNQKYNTVCLSDDSVSLDFDKEKDILIKAFNKILPEKCCFEK